MKRTLIGALALTLLLSACSSPEQSSTAACKTEAADALQTDVTVASVEQHPDGGDAFYVKGTTAQGGPPWVCFSQTVDGKTYANLMG